MKYYSKFDFYNFTSHDVNGAFLHHFKTFQQKQDNTCGPCCLKMCLNFFGEQKSEEELAILAKTRPFPYGTKLKGMTGALKKLGYNTFSSIETKRDLNGLVFSTYLEFRNFVVETLKNNKPIIVENIDWGGHYKVIIGIDIQSKSTEQDMLIFADPADLYDGEIDGYNYGSAEQFFYMWFDDHCIEKKYRKQPFIVVDKK